MHQRKGAHEEPGAFSRTQCVGAREATNLDMATPGWGTRYIPQASKDSRVLRSRLKMELWVAYLSVFPLVALPLCGASPATPVRPLSVLIITPDAQGHFSPLLALGEELMERGHGVTVAGERKTKESMRLSQLCFERGIPLYQYGSDMVDWNGLLKRVDQAGPFVYTALFAALHALAKIQDVFIEALQRDVHLLKGTDVVVLDFMLPAVTHWLNTNTNLTIISHTQGILVSVTSLPLWYYPIHTVGPHPTLLDRLHVTAGLGVVQAYLNTFGLHYKQYIPLYTPAGVYNPDITGVAFGFDYPRPLYPMMHYVGPMMSRRKEVLEDELQTWLDRHHPKRVLYVSMGSMFNVTHQMARSVVEAAVQSNYDILWTMKDGNRHVLDGINQTVFKNGAVFISKWLPQGTVLRHPSISMAILHCGLGGLNEALTAGVPVIGTPIAMDQFTNCGRMHHQGLGVCLGGAVSITSDLLQHSIREIDRGPYRDNIKKVNAIFKEAGGVERAADLIEYYHDVGYDHLVPYWAKYQWNAIQYYNLDLYTIIAAVAALVGFTLCKCTCCVCGRVCRMSHSVVANKAKKD